MALFIIKLVAINKKVKMLSRDQVANVVRDRDTYYDGMLRNGWILPAKKQSICTLDFMERARAGEIFCPRA